MNTQSGAIDDDEKEMKEIGKKLGQICSLIDQRANHFGEEMERKERHVV